MLEKMSIVSIWATLIQITKCLSLSLCQGAADMTNWLRNGWLMGNRIHPIGGKRPFYQMTWHDMMCNETNFLSCLCWFSLRVSEYNLHRVYYLANPVYAKRQSWLQIVATASNPNNNTMHINMTYCVLTFLPLTQTIGFLLSSVGAPVSASGTLCCSVMCSDCILRSSQMLTNVKNTPNINTTMTIYITVLIFLLFGAGRLTRERSSIFCSKQKRENSRKKTPIFTKFPTRHGTFSDLFPSFIKYIYNQNIPWRVYVCRQTLPVPCLHAPLSVLNLFWLVYMPGKVAQVVWNLKQRNKERNKDTRWNLKLKGRAFSTGLINPFLYIPQIYLYY